MRQAVREAFWDLGPHLAEDGHTLVIPSPYKPEAVAFWKAQGFQWRPEWKTWERDTRSPKAGRRYTAAAWVKAARRKYAEFWPLWAAEQEEVTR
jgi:hypothetical protein